MFNLYLKINVNKIILKDRIMNERSMKDRNNNRIRGKM